MAVMDVLIQPLQRVIEVEPGANLLDALRSGRARERQLAAEWMKAALMDAAPGASDARQ